MAEERFNVIVFDDEGYWHYADRDLSAERAVTHAKLLTVLAEKSDIPEAADIARVMITDSDDMTNFLWERGKGIVFPTREDVEP